MKIGIGYACGNALTFRIVSSNRLENTWLLPLNQKNKQTNKQKQKRKERKASKQTTKTTTTQLRKI